MLRLRTAALLAGAAVLASAMAGCSSTVSLEPGAQANDPLCAEVTVRLPDSVSGEQRRWTDAQATGAWGDPATVLLTCGVEPPGPTTLTCVEVKGVDWIVDESQAPRYRLTTYGRTPAVELFIDTQLRDDGTGVTSRAVLDALSPLLAQQLPEDAACVSRADATPVDEPVEP